MTGHQLFQHRAIPLQKDENVSSLKVYLTNRLMYEVAKLEQWPRQSHLCHAIRHTIQGPALGGATPSTFRVMPKALHITGSTERKRTLVKHVISPIFFCTSSGVDCHLSPFATEWVQLHHFALVLKQLNVIHVKHLHDNQAECFQGRLL